MPRGVWERPSRHDLFWKKVEKTDTCWLWRGTSNNTSHYGIFWNGERLVMAHRWAYEEANGPLGKEQVAHHCDVRLCVRPDHLFEATRVENMQDAVAKKRIASGDRAPIRLHPERYPTRERKTGAKLTTARAAEIRTARANGEPLASVAHRFGVSTGLVSMVANGKRWA
jgi:HNH endonuclease